MAECCCKHVDELLELWNDQGAQQAPDKILAVWHKITFSPMRCEQCASSPLAIVANCAPDFVVACDLTAETAAAWGVVLTDGQRCDATREKFRAEMVNWLSGRASMFDTRPKLLAMLIARGILPPPTWPGQLAELLETGDYDLLAMPNLAALATLCTAAIPPPIGGKFLRVGHCEAIRAAITVASAITGQQYSFEGYPLRKTELTHSMLLEKITSCCTYPPGGDATPPWLYETIKKAFARSRAAVRNGKPVLHDPARALALLNRWCSVRDHMFAIEIFAAEKQKWYDPYRFLELALWTRNHDVIDKCMAEIMVSGLVWDSEYFEVLMRTEDDWYDPPDDIRRARQLYGVRICDHAMALYSLS